MAVNYSIPSFSGLLNDVMPVQTDALAPAWLV
jgi:hypothetical protein